MAVLIKPQREVFSLTGELLIHNFIFHKANYQGSYSCKKGFYLVSFIKVESIIIILNLYQKNY
jgi:hypothetical protein